MDIRPILLSLKQNKFFALMVVLQVALTLAAVSHSAFSVNALLKGWNKESGLVEESLIIERAQFFVDDIDVGSVIPEDLEKLRRLPGVQAVTTTNQIPFSAEGISEVFKQAGTEAQRYLASVFQLNASALDVLGIELIAGRDFNENEVVRGQLSATTEYPSVILISEALAQEVFGEENPIGKTLWPVRNAQPAEVIGVYSDFMTGEILNGIGKPYNSAIRPMVVWSAAQLDPGYLMRVEPGTAEGLLEDVRDVIYQQRGRYMFRNEVLTRTKKRMFDASGSQAMIMTSVSIVLVLITAFGMVGLVSFLVKQRQRQIGIRRALGAAKKDILKYFLLENSLLTIAGLVLGVIITIGIAVKYPTLTGNEFIRYDLIFFVAVFLWLVNMAAVYWPAKKASKVNPALVMS